MHIFQFGNATLRLHTELFLELRASQIDLESFPVYPIIYSFMRGIVILDDKYYVTHCCLQRVTGVRTANLNLDQQALLSTF